MQKTAYEMRISDWSSDVCSSDLDAGLVITDANAERIGALIGSGIGGLLGIEEQTARYLEGGVRKISPFYVPSTIINMLPGQVSILNGLKGPNFSAVSACATANHSIGLAMRLIQYGDADVMLAGGAQRGSSTTDQQTAVRGQSV